MDERVDLTDLIRRAEQGDSEASDRLFAATYADLCTLARLRLMSGGRNPLLDTGSLVHESYLRFVTSGSLKIEDRVHFLRWAGRVMRSVIVDFARRRSAARRGSGAAHLALTDEIADQRTGSVEEILAVHEALDDLTSVDPRLVQIVELRYFGGLTETEIAQALGVTERTVRRDWQKGQLMLRAVLE
jgi:RNA polymerase sigma factor (TIGR02999 family)